MRRQGLLRAAFFLLVVRPVMLVLVGLHVRHRERLPERGPAVLAPNHNSHLDTMALMALFPLRVLPRVRPVAAADYWTSHPLLAWFSRNVLGVVPLARGADLPREEKLAGVRAALEREEILILFPEGSRGTPEELAPFRSGVAWIAMGRPGTRVYPVFLHGLGKVLPRGEGLLVPLACDVVVGEPLELPAPGDGDGDGRRRVEAFMSVYAERMAALAAEGEPAPWE